MRELFIYYRVAEARAAQARATAVTMQADLRRAHPQLQTRLLRRPDMVDGQQTWMETYATDANCAGSIDAAIQAAIEQAALALLPWLASPRHVEVFIPCAS